MNIKQVSTTSADERHKNFGPQLNQSIPKNNNYELNNIFYIIIVLILNLISILNIIFKLKYIIEFNDNNHAYDIYMIINNHYQILISLVLIIILTILFLRYSLISAKTDNLAINNNQLGDDLVTICQENLNKISSTYFSKSSTSSESSISPTPSLECDLSPLARSLKKYRPSFSEKIKFYKKFYSLPVNIMFHLIVCLVILLVKIFLKLKISDLQSLSPNTTLVQINNNNNNNTLVVSNYNNNNNNYQIFSHADLSNLFYNSQILINIDYFNYFFALLMLLIKFSRVYMKLNTFFTTILIINLFVYMIQNLSTILTIDFIFTLPKPVAKSYENTNLVFLKFVVINIFQNKLFLLLSYLTSWFLNLFYYTAFNIYIIYYYNKAHLKLIAKYKCYLNRYYNPPLSTGTSSSASSTSSTASTTYSIMETVHQTSLLVLTQYKAIIFGIVILLMIEVLQIPYLYTCYSSYNFNIAYLIALLIQLVFLLLNAFIWIILTLKQKWKFNFTLKFQILLWHTLFYNYLNEYYSGVHHDIGTNTTTSGKSDVESQNIQVKMLLLRKQQQIPKSFVNVISITNEKLNKIDENELVGADVEENINNLSIYNDNRSECSTATTSISQPQQVSYKARISTNDLPINSNNNNNNNRVNNQHYTLQHNPQIVKKIVQMNRNNKRIIHVDPKQQQQKYDSNIISSWNEFNVNERN
jgi:hypothetical protein